MLKRFSRSQPQSEKRIKTARRRLLVERLEDRRVFVGIPLLNSNPSGSATLFLDFDGHFESVWGGFTNVTSPALDFDGIPNDVNSAEATYIQEVWTIVAEDFAPFNINVTTVQPAVLASGVPTSQANCVALRCE